MSTTDAMTDLVCDYEDFDGGLVHRGIKKAATWLLGLIAPLLRENVEKLQPSALYVVGHSLGAGVATLLCLFLSRQELPVLCESVPGFQITCYAFGPPPILSEPLARQCDGFAATFVNENDLVPRLCLGSVMDTRSLLLAAIKGVENHFTETWRVREFVRARVSTTSIYLYLTKKQKKIYHLVELGPLQLSLSSPVS